MTSHVEYSNIQTQEHKRNHDGIAMLHSRFKRQAATPTHKQRPGGDAMSKERIRYLDWHEVPANSFPPCTVRNTRTTRNIISSWHFVSYVSYPHDISCRTCHILMIFRVVRVISSWYFVSYMCFSPYMVEMDWRELHGNIVIESSILKWHPHPVPACV